ncbi:MAG: hypothetical protein ACPGO3_00105 [Magnetospiraceae bacterium]
MELLFKRDQTLSTAGKVKFKLWGKVELDDDEKEIVRRYRFDQAILIDAFQPLLIRRAALIGVGIFIVGGGILSTMFDSGAGFFFGALAGGAAGYWHYHQKPATASSS